ncbi:MAG TPA: hypothetical protein VIP11_04040, partial [Gemmatimonadaceae bacterium]
ARETWFVATRGGLSVNDDGSADKLTPVQPAHNAPEHLVIWRSGATKDLLVKRRQEQTLRCAQDDNLGLME